MSRKIDNSQEQKIGKSLDASTYRGSYATSTLEGALPPGATQTRAPFEERDLPYMPETMPAAAAEPKPAPSIQVPAPEPGKTPAGEEPIPDRATIESVKAAMAAMPKRAERRSEPRNRPMTFRTCPSVYDKAVEISIARKCSIGNLLERLIEEEHDRLFKGGEKG